MVEQHRSPPLTDADFPQLVLQAPHLVLVDFWATWCAPCFTLAKTLEALAPGWTGRVAIYGMNIEAEPNAAVAYSVRSLPTILLFRGGVVVKTLVGMQSRAQLEKTIPGYF